MLLSLKSFVAHKYKKIDPLSHDNGESFKKTALHRYP